MSGNHENCKSAARHDDAVPGCRSTVMGVTGHKKIHERGFNHMTTHQALFGAQHSVKGMVLKVSPNGRYLTDQTGKPFFYLGDTAWTLLKRLNRKEIDLYYHNRLAKGFNVIQMYLLRGLNVTDRYGNTPLIDGDPAKPNELFYKDVDYAINRANELGLVIGGVVTWAPTSLPTVTMSRSLRWPTPMRTANSWVIVIRIIVLSGIWVATRIRMSGWTSGYPWPKA